jgi:hypothetical protein
MERQQGNNALMLANGLSCPQPFIPDNLPMPHPLDPLDPGFLATLGRQGTQDQFMRLLEPPETKTAHRFHWQPGASAEQRMAVSPGALLLFQRIVPHAQADQVQWGLRSFTLHSTLSPLGAAWTQAWPANLPAETATLADVSAVFGAPEVDMRGMAIFTLKGPQDQSWGLHCQFGDTGRLQTFTVAHLGQWLPLIEDKPAEPAVIAEPSVSSGPPIICGTGGVAPKAGWYEGLLPDWHAAQVRFSRDDARFVHREKGQRMIRLGVDYLEDEMLLVWTWRGEQRPQ